MLQSLAIPLLALSLAMPAVGERAPDFTTGDFEGRPVQLAQLLKKGPVILAFFPRAHTRVCTAELSAYQKALPQLAEMRAQVVAVSRDDSEAMRSFVRELGATYTFVADAKGELTKLYDVNQPLIRMAKRVTFLINTDGSIGRVDTGGDAADPAELLRALRPAPVTK